MQDPVLAKEKNICHLYMGFLVKFLTMGHNSFAEFLKQNRIKHICSVPYQPQMGKQNAFVQTFKHTMKASKCYSGTLETKLARFLLMYRNTPNSTTGRSLAELLFHRTLQTRLSLLRPSVADTVVNKQASQKEQYDRRGEKGSLK